MASKILVVGGGPSGLVSLKECLAEGHDACIVEASHRLGGVFADEREAAYESLLLTTSNYFMCYSDMPPKKGEPIRYWKKDEYAKYLQDYAKHHDLLPRVRLNCKVRRAAFVDNKWCVEFEGSAQQEIYDALIVATGSNHVPKVGEAPGFSGEQLHSSEYKEPSRFKDKTVLVVGFGESAADMGPEISDVAKRTVMWGRRRPAFAPRFPILMADPDFDEYKAITDPNHKFELCDFLEYSTTARIQQEPSVGLMGAGKQQYFRGLETDSNMPLAAKFSLGLIQRATRHTYYRADLSMWVTKNGRPIKPIISGRLEFVVAAKVSFEPNAATFSEVFQIGLDETAEDPNKTFRIDNLDTIVWCTGYKTHFKWLEVPNIEMNPRTWYKHCLPPHYGPKLAFIGWARGHQGGIPQMAEMCARYVALLLSGKRKLPANYEELAIAEGQAEEVFFVNSPNLKSLVDYPSYMDSVAKLIGCKPSAPWNPLRFAQYYTYPLWCYWYRSVGPHAKPEVLRDVLDRFPFPSKGIRMSIDKVAMPFFSCSPFLFIACVQTVVQKVVNIIGILASPFVDRKTRELFLKPKHFVLHGNSRTPIDFIHT